MPPEPQVQVFFDRDAVQDDDVEDGARADDPIRDKANQDEAGEQVLPDPEDVTEDGDIEAE